MQSLQTISSICMQFKSNLSQLKADVFDIADIHRTIVRLVGNNVNLLHFALNFYLRFKYPLDVKIMLLRNFQSQFYADFVSSRNSSQ